MSDLDKNKLSPQRLAVERMTRLLQVQSGVVLFLTAIGISQLFVRHFLLAAAALVAAATLALIVFSLWKQHRMKAGTAVYAVLPRSDFQMPQIVSIAVVLVLAVFVSTCSAFIIYITIANFNTQVGWTFCGLTLLAVWLFIAH